MHSFFEIISNLFKILCYFRENEWLALSGERGFKGQFLWETVVGY